MLRAIIIVIVTSQDPINITNINWYVPEPDSNVLTLDMSKETRTGAAVLSPYF